MGAKACGQPWRWDRGWGRLKQVSAPPVDPGGWDVRTGIEAWQGLAVLGLARAGPFSFATPQLLESWIPGDPVREPTSFTLREDTSPSSGVRRIVVGFGPEIWPLDLPINAPEIAGPTPVQSIGPEVAVVHGPIPPEFRPPPTAPTPSLVILANAKSLWADGEPFVETVDTIRSLWGGSPILWAPRIALPHRIPFLAYMGVDLMDDTEGRIRDVGGARFDESLGIISAKAETSGTDKATFASATAIRSLYANALRQTQEAVREGMLRELVEARLVSEPTLGEMLRYADRILASHFEERTPVTGRDLHNYVIAESHRRPEMERFRSRLQERYRPPKSKEVLLLVPCSRTKPYRRSPSHRRLAAALDGLRPAERIHWVSVSSPIGLVPAELEDTYPARHYDIPVTGEWLENERKIVQSAFDHLVAAGSYRALVLHLDPAEYGFLSTDRPGAPPAVWTVQDGRTTSPGSLRTLREAIQQALEGSSPVPRGPLTVVREELHEVAAFQFGRDAADRLFADPLRLHGRPWFQRLSDGQGADLATWREERGLFQLTVKGAERIHPVHCLEVEVAPDVRLSGDLFTPGVRRADPRIRSGDAVVLTRDDRVVAVGEAALPGRLMTEVARGLAVQVRHHAVSVEAPVLSHTPPGRSSSG
jgi:archaeosine synthase